MDTTPPVARFEQAYRDGDPPWVIDEPQPAVVALADDGAFTGTVVDLGCGTGEHTVLLAARGVDVRGADASPTAVERAGVRAAAAGIPDAAGRFVVVDALDPAVLGPVDTVLDSALFHVFDADDQARYARGLAGIVRTGGVVHLLALARTGTADDELGPVVDEAQIHDAFAGPAWTVQEVRRTTYRGVVTAGLAESSDRTTGDRFDLPAFLARITRT